MEYTEVLRLFIMGMSISLTILPTIILLVGCYTRSEGILSFFALLCIHPVNFILRFTPVHTKEYINVRVNDDSTQFRCRFASFIPFYFSVEKSELADLYENYGQYNNLPLKNEDYPYLEGSSFYDGVNLNTTRCDCCRSGNGTHTINGKLLGIVPAQQMFCSDCFDEVTETVSQQIEENPEVMLASEI